MNWTTAKIAELLNGELEGEPHIVISKLARLEHASEGALTFFSDPKYKQHLTDLQASALIVGRDFTPETPLKAALIRVGSPYEAFNKLLYVTAAQALESPRIEDGAFIDPTATIGPDAYIGRNAYISAGVTVGAGARIYPGVYIGRNVRLGDGVLIYPYAVLYADTLVGDRCVIHANAVIGSDGFGFLQDATGRNIKIPHVGRVVLEDDVEIGAGSTIDRGTLDETRICRGVKLDNLVHVAHNARIGDETVIAAQSGVSGSVRIGKHCMIGGQVGFVGHIEVVDQVKIGAKTGVQRSLTEAGVYRGGPVYPLQKQLRIEVATRNLPDLFKRVEELEARLAALGEALPESAHQPTDTHPG